MNILDRLALLPLALTFILYPVAAKPILSITSFRWRIALFATLNVLSTLALIVAETVGDAPLDSSGFLLYMEVCGLIFLIYLGFVLTHYAVLSNSSSSSDRTEWVAFLFPLIVLCLIKYWPAQADPLSPMLAKVGNNHRASFFIGISYMAFRLSHLVREVQNGAVAQPTLAEYLAFAFFIPTMTLGPINAYSKMQRSLAGEGNTSGTSGQAWLRILIGLTKYLFLATLLNQLTYDGLLLDGHPHAPIDLLIALPAYTLYLYCNFSGFCDMVIGVSMLLGIEVSENFDRPFTARNLQEFWTRWHITLSTWFRDMMFTPLLKVLVRRFGPKSTNHLTPFTIFVVFLVLGVWHGVGVNFLLFGVLQGLGLVTVHYYRIILKQSLSKQHLAAYQRSRGIRLASSVLTFTYFSITLFFFANNMNDIHRIADAIV